MSIVRKVLCADAKFSVYVYVRWNWRDVPHNSPNDMIKGSCLAEWNAKN